VRLGQGREGRRGGVIFVFMSFWAWDGFCAIGCKYGRKDEAENVVSLKSQQRDMSEGGEGALPVNWEPKAEYARRA
jgi:hypothetical protein